METLVYLLLASKEATVALTGLVPELITLIAIYLLLRSAGAKSIYFWLYAAAIVFRLAVLFGQILSSANDSGIQLDPGIFIVLAIIAGYFAPLCLLVIALKLQTKKPTIKNVTV
jgi:hypothetical protein